MKLNGSDCNGNETSLTFDDVVDENFEIFSLVTDDVVDDTAGSSSGVYIPTIKITDKVKT